MTNPLNVILAPNQVLTYAVPNWLVAVYLNDADSNPVNGSEPAFCFSLIASGPASGAITICDSDGQSLANGASVTPSSTLGAGLLSAIKTYLEGVDYDSYAGQLGFEGATAPLSVAAVYVSEYKMFIPAVDITP